jgi:CheY-like chemotaxis protein
MHLTSDPAPAAHKVVLEMRILVVEDERTPASFIEQRLRAEGHAVTVGHDGESSEAAALTGDYALVLLDLLCPARAASTCLERSARMPEPASDRADGAHSRRAERGLDRGAND